MFPVIPAQRGDAVAALQARAQQPGGE